jgi:D-3-phosphoglycerate dehydrogenase
MSGAFKVLVTDHVFPNLEPEKVVLGAVGAEVIFAGKDADEAKILELAKDADAILNCYKKIPAQLYSTATKCKIIVRYGIGTDTIDIPEATKYKIAISNVPDYCIDEVSDHAMTHILNSVRKISVANKMIKGGTWSLGPLKPIKRLSSLTLGLYGFGRIPRMVAEKARAFGFKLIACDPYVNKTLADQLGVQIVSFDELCTMSDIISIHAPLTPETNEIFNHASFGKMKDGVIIVNTARGGLIKEADLVEALKSGKVGGAGLDVTNPEPPAKDNPLFAFDNVTFSPHESWYSEEALVELQDKAALEVARVLKGEAPKYQLNKF